MIQEGLAKVINSLIGPSTHFLICLEVFLVVDDTVRNVVSENFYVIFSHTEHKKENSFHCPYAMYSYLISALQTEIQLYEPVKGESARCAFCCT